MKRLWHYLFPKPNCRRCRDKGYYTYRVRIPYDQLSPIDKAEIWVNGGYAYDLVRKECDHDLSA